MSTVTKNFKLITILATICLVLSGCTFNLDRISSLLKQSAPEKPPVVTEEEELPVTAEEKPKTVSEQLTAQSKIKKFTDYDELKEFLAQAPAYETNQYYARSALGIGMAEDMALSAPMEKSVASEEAGASSHEPETDFSKTNVQVEGVDEADIVKTDGRYIYAVVKNNIYIIEAYPAAVAKIVSTVKLESRPQELYVNGDYLAVFGANDIIYKEAAESGEMLKIRRPVPWQSHTFFKVYDLSDKTDPKETRNLDFEGNYFNSRLIGDYVYFLTTAYKYYYDGGDPVPLLRENGQILPLDCAGNTRCFHPDVYYFNIPYESYNFTTVSAINLKDAAEAVSAQIYLLAGNQNMYVSPANLYITYTKYLSEYQLEMEVLKEIVLPRLKTNDQERIRKIEAVDNDILSSQEKWQKIVAVIETYRYTLSQDEQKNLETELENAIKQKYQDIAAELEKTVVHKIALSGRNLEYKAEGEVKGHVLNQFSLDENNGYLRIATTKSQTWSRWEKEGQESYSNVFVLDENLKVAGALEKLAPGERIYSARFMQNRAYLVTFKQMDPLFTIDLADPAHPRVLGELKIPGFSDYLHPYDDTTLVGLGLDTETSEWGGVRTKGVKLSLFDVADVANPKEIDNYIIGEAGSDSIARHDHKAFLFSRDKSLLVIPVSVRESVLAGGYGKLTFSGAAILTVTKDGIDLKGKIDHSDGGQPSNSDYWGGYEYYDNMVKRGLYINEALYTFSNKYLKVNKIEDLTELSSVTF